MSTTDVIVQTSNVDFLSHVIGEDTPAWAGRVAFERSDKKSIKCNGDSCNEQSWQFNSNHIGTHIDVPYHFHADGYAVSDMAAGDFVFRKVQLIDHRAGQAELIDLQKFEIDADADFLLIRTGFESVRAKTDYWEQGPGLTADSGMFLREKFPGIKGVGFDFISLTSYQHRDEGRRAHQVFLDPNGIGHPLLIIEDMHLQKLQRAPSTMIVSPVRVAGADGGPVTVLAFS